MSRTGTGLLKIGDDWTGVFIRGDDAVRFAFALDDVLNNNNGDYARDIASELKTLLFSANENALLRGDATLQRITPCEPS